MLVTLETGWRGQVDGLGLPRPKNFTSRDSSLLKMKQRENLSITNF